MDDRNFDALTRAVAQGASRRTTLKLIAGGALAGIAALFSGRPSRAQPAQQQKIFLPAVVTPRVPPTYLEATPAQLQALVEQAKQNNDFRAFQTLLANGGLNVTLQESIVAARGGALDRQILLVHYEGAAPSDLAYLVFGLSGQGERVVFAMRYDTVTKIAFGLYRDMNRQMQVELERPRPGVTAHAAAPRAPGPAAVSGDCQTCLDVCSATSGLRRTSCAIRGAAAVFEVGLAANRLARTTTETLADPLGDISALSSGLTALSECLQQRDLDCSPSGSVCSAVCTPCSSDSDPGGCGGGSLCIAGVCRVPCGGTFCGVGEACGPGGSCLSPVDQCQSRTYMGLYRFGSTARLVPGCCPIVGGLNCGAQITGNWGGCCPPGTVCFPLNGSTGYGCCIPGGTCSVLA